MIKNKRGSILILIILILIAVGIGVLFLFFSGSSMQQSFLCIDSDNGSIIDKKGITGEALS